MKKRLSLLMVLMMIVSLLPMSAFAATAYPGSVPDVDVDSKFKLSTEFELTRNTGLVAGDFIQFRLNGAEFATTDNTASDYMPRIIVTKADGTDADAIVANVAGSGLTLNKDTLYFTVPAAESAGANKIIVTVDGWVDVTDEGDVKLIVEDSGSSIGSQTVTVAKGVSASKADLAITARDAEKTVSFDGGELSQFEVKNFGNVDAADKIEIELDDSDLSLTANTVVIVDGVTFGYSATAATQKYTISNGKIVLFAGDVDSTTKLIVVIPEVSAGRKAVEGNISVTVSAVKTDGKTRMSERATIGKMVDYAVTMTVVERNKKEIPNVWGGEEARVTVTLKGPKGSILARDIDFTVDGADVKYNTISPITTKPSSTLTVDGKEVVKTSTYKDAEFALKGVQADTEEVKFDMVIKTDADKDGVATITAAQRGWEVTSDLAKVTPKIAIKADVTPIKKGEAKDTANVVITEAKAGLLGKNDKIQLTFDTKRDYVEFTTKSIKVEATNGMTFGDVAWGKAVVGKTTDDNGTTWKDKTETVKYVIEIPVNKTSSGEAAVITVSGLKVAVDGSTTDDVVKINAQLNGDTAAKADYIKVVKEYDMESILSIFTIGQTAYTVNGETKAAHSAPYIKEGRTMLPIRAVAESLGLTVQWNSATRTASFTDASKVAAVTIGAKVMYVNGTPMPLTVPAELVNDTTFVELRSLATAFGVQIDWDAAAKTATVSK